MSLLRIPRFSVAASYSLVQRSSSPSAETRFWASAYALLCLSLWILFSRDSAWWGVHDQNALSAALEVPL